MQNLALEIWSYWSDGGVLLLPIAGVSSMIFLHLWRLSRDFQSALREVERIEEQLEVGSWKTRERRPARDDPRGVGPVPVERAVFAAVERSFSGAAARERVESVLGARRARLDGRIGILAALTAAAPLLGLLGTVSGMTATFAATAAAADPARQAAGGIGVALMTTQYGLAAALPGVFGLVHIERLRSRLRRSDGAVGMLIYIAGSREVRHV